ncbi:MAG TPA: biotin--[acetyl-CoA-carboxylase] ligase [Stellaceae bacterium]|nr:biotin--[acetyl-CoA-carboxylase] ligase [Stellaceae bacterium]
MSLPRPLLPAAYRLDLRDTVGSTNDEAKALARDGAEAGTVVAALEQTAGRGRRGRSWSSPRGNLYASLILRPACSAEHAAQLGFVAAIAVGEALSELAEGRAAVAYKWPNDVLTGSRKIAGILLESETGRDDRLAFLVLGVGVNLASAPSETEFPATSFAAEGWPPPTAQTALAALLRHFEIWAARWQQQGFGPVREAWRACAFALGGQIRARLETATLHGRFVDIDQQGALLLEIGGELRRISAGDVFPAH